MSQIIFNFILVVLLYLGALLFFIILVRCVKEIVEQIIEKLSSKGYKPRK